MDDMRERVLALLGADSLTTRELAERAVAAGLNGARAERELEALVADKVVHLSGRGNHKVLEPRIGAKSSRTGWESWLIFCPEIEPDSYVHLNVQGDSYKIRGFAGARGYWGPEHARGATTTREFIARYGGCMTSAAGAVRQEPNSMRLDEEPGRTAWRERILDLNRRRHLTA